MRFFHKLFFSGILLGSLILTGPAFSADPEATNQLPEIIPGTQSPKKLPTLGEVTKIIQGQFAGLKYYQTGDLITRNQVRPVFKQLQKAGWDVKEQKEILNRVHADNDFLATQLRTPKGIKFMRKISRLPEGYDRLDHILVMPYGKRRIKEFINSPGGNLMIEYMTTTKGGKNLGKYLSQTKTGKGFNAPTRRIYTEAQLVQVLQKAYVKATQENKRKS